MISANGMETRTGTTAILVVDDHEVVRLGLREVISHEPDLRVCGEAAEATEAMALARETRPDVVIVDLSLKDSNGMDLIKDISALMPAAAILVLSMHDESFYAERALRAGAQGYVMKEEGTDNIIEAIRKVMAGRIYLSPRMSSLMLEKAAGRTAQQRSPESALSNRELEVFELVGQGLGPTDVAQRLGLSVKTVETYRSHIKDKLGLKNATALRRRAIDWVHRGRQI